MMNPTDRRPKADRRAWVQPALTRIDVAAAELAPRTTNPDGAFSRTS